MKLQLENLSFSKNFKFYARLTRQCLVCDGHAVNMGDCNAKSGQYVDALVDQKIKERATLMNPTN